MRKIVGRFLIVILVLAVFGFAGNEDRKDKEVTQDIIKQVADVGIVYSKHAAFHKASPTPDQMEATEALLQIQPLVSR